MTLNEATPVSPKWHALIDALFFLGAGSRREFSVLARQLEDTAAFESRLLLDLEALGIIELERNAELTIVQWEVAATCIGQLTDGSWLLSGYWDSNLAADVLKALENHGAVRSVKGVDRQSSHVVDKISQEAVLAVANHFEIACVPQAAMALALALPPLSVVGAGLPRDTMPFAESYEYFSPQSATWLTVEAAALPGLYRVSQSFSSRYYFRDFQDISTNQAARVSVELGKHLAALTLNRPLIAYDPDDRTLSVPVGAELPGLYARSAALGDGDLPKVRTSDRSINYLNVPAKTAEVLIGKLTS